MSWLGEIIGTRILATAGWGLRSYFLQYLSFPTFISIFREKIDQHMEWNLEVFISLPSIRPIGMWKHKFPRKLVIISSVYLVLKKGVVQVNIKSMCKSDVSWNPFDRISHAQHSPFFNWLRVFLSEIDMNNLQEEISVRNEWRYQCIISEIINTYKTYLVLVVFND